MAYPDPEKWREGLAEITLLGLVGQHHEADRSSQYLDSHLRFAPLEAQNDKEPRAGKT